MPSLEDTTPLAVHPNRVRAALDPRLSDATVARLLACGRLRGRLAALLDADAEMASDAAESAWLLADPRGAALRAGAIFHARALREVVLGPEVTRLVTAIGEDAHAVGLRHAAEAAPRPNGDDLAEAIERDGLSLLGAWLRTQLASLRRAALLRLPPGTAAEEGEIDPAVSEHADAIMDAVRAAGATDQDEQLDHEDWDADLGRDDE